MRAVHVFSSLVLIILGGFAVQARAADSAAESADLWLLAKYDHDGDRAISISEISNKRERQFARMDGNSDGVVSFQEYLDLDVKKRELLLQARFMRLDADHDGRLSSAEYGSYSGAFDQLDMNGDGRLTEEEMVADPSLQPTDLGSLNADNTHCLLWFCIKTKLE